MDERVRTRATRSRGWVWFTVGAVGVAVVLVAWALVLPPDAPQAAQSVAPTGNYTPSKSPSATPTPTPTKIASAPTETASPTPEPTKTSSPLPPELSPVDAANAAQTPSGVVVELERVEAIDGQAAAAGETSGPALRFTVTVVNDTDTAIPLGYVVVNAYTGASRVPAPAVMQPGGDPMSGSLKPGKSASGVYLFTIPEDQRADVTVGVDYLEGEPTAIFRGSFS